MKKLQPKSTASYRQQYTMVLGSAIRIICSTLIKGNSGVIEASQSRILRAPVTRQIEEREARFDASSRTGSRLSSTLLPAQFAPTFILLGSCRIRIFFAFEPKAEPI